MDIYPQHNLCIQFYSHLNLDFLNKKNLKDF